MRILALDWGTVRVGAAISDPEGMMAFPLDKFLDSKSAVEEIKNIVSEQSVEKIVIGMPKSLSGADTESSKLVESFAQDIQKSVPCPIEFLDERFSSKGAGKILSDQGLSQKQQRGQVDNLAAQQMLQTYLDTRLR